MSRPKLIVLWFLATVVVSLAMGVLASGLFGPPWPQRVVMALAAASGLGLAATLRNRA